MAIGKHGYIKFWVMSIARKYGAKKYGAGRYKVYSHSDGHLYVVPKLIYKRWYR